MRRLIPLLVLLLATSMALSFSVACGGGGSDATATPGPTTSGPPDLSPQVGGIEAARLYLRETGIDGKKGDLTDPRSCAEIDDDTDGQFCVQENFSTFAAGLVILRLGNADKPQDEVWEMRLSLDDERWQVTSVMPFGEDE